MVMEQTLQRPGRRPGGPLAVQTAGLTKRFGQRTVVDDVALEIPQGAVCGFVGPNGAGKTTTIRMLLGLVRPTSGGGTILGGSLAEPATYLRKVGAQHVPVQGAILVIDKALIPDAHRGPSYCN